MLKLVDAHCHINDSMYDEDRSKIIEEINENMEFVVCSGWDYNSSIEAIKLANENKKIYASIGFHPTDISTMTEEKLTKLENLARENKKIVGIGEIGLDYYHMRDDKQTQKDGLITQIEMIRRLKKPIVVHTREALKDTMDILESYSDVGGILHCYPGSYEACQKILDRYFVSVGGVVTFKNGRKTKEMVSKVPIENIVIETDSPYLTPTPYRGRRNSPLYTMYVASEISKIKDMKLEDVIEITTQNAKRGYNI